MVKTLFQGSWKTTAVGIAEALVLWVIEELRNGVSVPQDAAGWLLWISGALRLISGLVQKDFNKTNAIVATPTTQTLPMTHTADQALVVANSHAR